jgi:hypothetical protein
VEEIAALTPNAALDLPHGVRAVTERGVLRFRRSAQRPKKQGARSAPP